MSAATERRRRLFNPPNAVVDLGIDLKRVPACVSAPVQEQPAEAGVVPEIIPHVENSAPTPETELIQENIQPPPRCFGITEIQHAVAHHFNIDRHEITASYRFNRVIRPRQIAMFLAQEMATPKPSLKRLGRMFGNRHHTTILHAHRAALGRIVSDPSFAADVETISQAIRARQ